MIRSLRFAVLSFLWILVLAPSADVLAVEPRAADAQIHWDWYFRESLTAIRDWET
ncbi:MAG: hypothetical protein ISR77_23990, partial [Pirellulaceae bacterium]|nr:hypothetical protein [Pirellulaceae bacterium]